MNPVRTLLIALSIMALGIMSAPGVATSEVGGLHLNITPYGGYADWAKEVNLENRAMFGGRLGLMFGRYLGVEGHYGWMTSETRYGTGDSLFFVPPSTSSTPTTDVEIQRYGADVVLNLIPGSGFNPYVLGGWHEEKISPDGSNVSTYMNGLEFGGGVKIGLGGRAALRAEIRDQLWAFDSPPAPNSDNIHNLVYTGGIQVSLGGSKGGDSDDDGIKDDDDRCPGTPKGARVDETGCPVDSDNDNVPDGIDQCPNTPTGATVDARGCTSDADSDGVPDGVDQCANTPAGTTVDARGCPADADNDGVPDGADQCANTPTGATVDARGCPTDADNDGVPDGIDQCPNTAAGAKVDARGCTADADNDGVSDAADLCPNTAAGIKVDKDGCPIELTEKETELLDKGRITVRDIHFETAKWDILPESYPILDDLGNILIQWPRLRIEIGGHADARGSDAYNLDLSDKRAHAVLDYLLSKFPQINREQYTAKGYGERVPVASNKTIEGMARNRRVEFKVLNTEELTKERERRRLLKQGE